MSVARKFGALWKKNLLIWGRNFALAVLEICLPIGAAAVLFYWSTHSNETYYTGEPLLRTAVPTYGNVSRWEQVVLGEVQLAPSLPNCRAYEYGQTKAALSPKGQITQALERQFKYLLYDVIYFASKDAIYDYMKSPDYLFDICFGVSVVQQSEGNLMYHIIMNTTNEDDPQIPSTNAPEVLYLRRQNLRFYWLTYYAQGFGQIQGMLDWTYMAHTGNGTFVEGPIWRMSPISSDPFKIQYEQAINLEQRIGLFIVLPLLFPFLSQTMAMLNEKESKIFSILKIMGMGNGTYLASWIAHYLCIYLVISISISLILYYSIFIDCQWSLLLVWHYLFSLNLIVQSMFLVCLLNSTRIGGITALSMYVLFFMIFYLVGDISTPYYAKVITSIIPQSAMTFGAQVFLWSEIDSVGVTWDDIFTYVRNYTIWANLGMNLASLLLFSVMTVLLVIFHKKEIDFYACIQGCGKKNKDKDELEEIYKEPSIEPPSLEQLQQDKEGKSVIIDNLSKHYVRGKLALSNFSLNMYRSQILALLGENGAGKTTLLSLITGTLIPTSGTISIFGLDPIKDTIKLQNFIGICPQFNILFPRLTVREHLELYSSLKHISGKNTKDAIAKVLQEVKMLEQSEQYAASLSGGQKRRLCIGIALLGDSQLILLDEPTSGADPAIRTEIWQIIKSIAYNRVILLTTHSMEEAETLADRITILRGGKLAMCGSKTFLKSQIQQKYTLCVFAGCEDFDEIAAIVAEHVPGSIVTAESSYEILFSLNATDSTQLLPLLQALSAYRYKIGFISLEDMFLRTSETGVMLKDDLPRRREKLLSCITHEDNDKCDQKARHSADELRAQILKRLKMFYMDIPFLLCSCAIPCLVLLSFLMIFLLSWRETNPAVDMTFQEQPLPINATIARYKQHSNWTTQQMVSYLNPTEFCLTTWPETVGPWFEGYGYTERRFETYISWNSSITRNFQIMVALEPEDGKMMKNVHYIVVNHLWRDNYPMSVNLMDHVYYKHYWKTVLQEENYNIKFRTYSAPMPWTDQQTRSSAITQSAALGLVFSLAAAFIPSSIIAVVILERTSGVKHLEFLAGAQVFIYWCANLIIDGMVYTAFMLFSFLMMISFGLTSFLDSDAFTATFLIFVLYGLSMIPMVYVTNLMFSNSARGQIFIFFLTFIMGVIFPMFILTIRIVETSDAEILDLTYILRLYPGYAFADGLMNIGARSLYQRANRKRDPYGPWELDIAGADIIYLAIEGPVFFLLLLFIDWELTTRTISHSIQAKQRQPKENAVMAEGDATAQVTEDIEQNAAIEVMHLVKKYGRKKCAVDDVSFKVATGECFSLLGVNGAGKSSTFKMLTNEILQTSGKIFMEKHDLSKPGFDFRQIGYCPQEQALINTLTVQQHLELFVILKNITKGNRKARIELMIDTCTLEKCRDSPAGMLSGGQRQRLQLAIALIDLPQIIFLDEPMSGLDPESRQLILNIIHSVKTIRTVVLTTHVMEDVEAVSTTIAIQDHGRLRYIGSLAYLNQQYSVGWEVIIIVSKPRIDEDLILTQDILVKFANQEITQEQVKAELGHIELGQMATPLRLEELMNELQALSSKDTENKEIIVEGLIQSFVRDNARDAIFQQFRDSQQLSGENDKLEIKIGQDYSQVEILQFLEAEKAKLKIIDYGIRSFSLNQIFRILTAEPSQEKSQVPSPKSVKELGDTVHQIRYQETDGDQSYV